MPWYVPAGLGAVASAVLAAGFVLALTGRIGEPVGPIPEASSTTPARAATHAGTEFLIVALGDSLTAGTGDARAGGYAGRLRARLSAHGRTVTLSNLAVAGAETADVLARLSDGAVVDAVRRADLIVLSAGGNDLSHTLRPGARGALGDPEPARARARTNLDALVKRLRSLNAAAPIRLVGLYNPFEVTPAEEPAARALIASWNELIEEASHADAGVLAVPIADLFLGRPDRLAQDRYHPGARGHALIAERVLETLPQGDGMASDEESPPPR